MSGFRWLVVAVSIFWAARALAADMEFEYFDTKACVHGSLSNMLSEEDMAPDSQARAIAKDRAIIALVGTPHCNGYCTFQDWDEDGAFRAISCDTDSCGAFPLRGATYAPVKDAGALKSYVCIKGCEHAPKYIHDMGYENEEGAENLLWEKMREEFGKVCSVKSPITVAGITPGASSAEVERVLGKPSSVKGVAPNWQLFYTGITVAMTNDKLTLLECGRPSCKTNRGVGVGDTIGAVVQAHGPANGEGTDPMIYLLEADGYILAFRIQAGRVVSVGFVQMLH